MAHTTIAEATAMVDPGLIGKVIAMAARLNGAMRTGATDITIEITGVGDRSFRELGAYGHTPLPHPAVRFGRRRLDAQI